MEQFGEDLGYKGEPAETVTLPYKGDEPKTITLPYKGEPAEAITLSSEEDLLPFVGQPTNTEDEEHLTCDGKCKYCFHYDFCKHELFGCEDEYEDF